MKTSLPFSLRTGLVLLFFLPILSFFGHKYYRLHMNEDEGVPVSLVGVHHLGSEYLIDRFYINKSIGDTIGEGGGGGSMVCCLMLPIKWNPKLKVDVRWEVDHIIKPTNPANGETVETEGIYRAQVAVEKYDKPGDFYVHFFPGGRVRLVVSEISSSSRQHPIQSGDLQASQTATVGTAVEKLFTPEDIAESEREIARDRKKYGDWR